MNTKALLENYGLKYEDLRSEERSTLEDMVRGMEANTLTIDIILEYINKLIYAVEEEMTAHNPKTFIDWIYRNERRRNLDARLRAYILLREMLTSPIKARKALDRMMRNMQKV